MRNRIGNAKRWISIADRDFALARQITDTFPDMSAYHLQQAVEKYLKAFLCLHGVPIKKSHDVSALLLKSIGVDGSFAVLASIGDPGEITSFATKFRYPNEEEVEFPMQEDLTMAIELCEQAQAIVLEKITNAEASLPPTDR